MAFIRGKWYEDAELILGRAGSKSQVHALSSPWINRLVNQHPWEGNAKIDKIFDVLQDKYYKEDHPASGAKAGDMQPGVIFAHNIESIKQISTRFGIETSGVELAKVNGHLGREREQAA